MINLVEFPKIYIKKFINLFGIDVVRKKKSFDDIYKKKIKNNPLIFDVGAHEGYSIDRFNLIFPKSIIHSFEPNKECYYKMFNSYSAKRFTLNNFALGEKNTNRKFFINKNSFTSSFYEINVKNKELYKNDRIINNVNVRTVTLDKYLSKNRIKKIDILKIDTQGYELNVLKGAKDALKKSQIKFIEIEIILDDYYQKNNQLHEIDAIMNKNNYYLFDISNLCYSKIYDKLKWFDMLYLNRNI